MQDNNVIERWNPISSAEMAVGVKSVLRRHLAKKPRPFDFDESVRSGIEFLKEACEGGAIISGEAQQTGFTGTLAPLTLTLEPLTSTLRAEMKGVKDSDTYYKRIVRTLSRYREVLEGLQENSKNIDKPTAEAAHVFFSRISDILMREADPLSKSVSEPSS